MKELNFAEIGRKIKEIRSKTGITQEYLANQVGVNVSHISNIENNHVKVSLSALVSICNTLHVTIDYVLSNEYALPDTSLDNELMKELQTCNQEKKEKLLQILHII